MRRIYNLQVDHVATLSNQITIQPNKYVDIKDSIYISIKREADVLEKANIIRVVQIPDTQYAVDTDVDVLAIVDPITDNKVDKISGTAGNIVTLGPDGSIVDSGLLPTDLAINQTLEQETFILTETDVINKYIMLTYTPIKYDEVILSIIGGPIQDYSVDYALDSITTKKLYWNGLGLDGILEVGDKLHVAYFRQAT